MPKGGWGEGWGCYIEPHFYFLPKYNFCPKKFSFFQIFADVIKKSAKISEKPTFTKIVITFDRKKIFSICFQFLTYTLGLGLFHQKHFIQTLQNT